MNATQATTEAHPKGQATVKGDDWRKGALCRKVEPEVFFPVGTGRTYNVQVELAKDICGGCPVMNECRAWARKTRQVFGVWGGESAEERLKAIRTRVCQQCKRVPIGSTSKFCGTPCRIAYDTQQARDRSRERFPDSRIA